MPRNFQELVYNTDYQLLTADESNRLSNWLAKPECQSAIPILQRMEIEKENAKARKAKTAKSKSKKAKGELL